MLLVVLSPTLAAVTIAGDVSMLVTRHRYARLTSQDLESQARAAHLPGPREPGARALEPGADAGRHWVAGAEDRALEQWTNRYVDELNVALAQSRMTVVVDAINSFLGADAPLLLLGVGAVLLLDDGRPCWLGGVGAPGVG